ncbi:MAG: hemerythrin domain-containing protein [Gemmatimonadota bacterium]|nr:MAG: hemerythrin domain-containing protein [Gemmatimonadota bacterium]
MGESRSATGMLREEHQLILRVLDVLQSLVEKGDVGEWDLEAWGDCVAFFRLFADACHHGKEEDLLFPELEARGMPRDSGPIAVMLYEHKQGRALVAQMAGALGGAESGEIEPLNRLEHAARAYLELLRAHIYKEDNHLFNMADFMVDKAGCDRLCAQYDVVCARRFEGRAKEDLENLAGNLLDRFGHP